MTTPSPSLSPPKVPNFMQEDDLADEFRELLSSLPRERSLLTYDLYNYEGVWFSPSMLHGLLACQNHFKPQDTDTILITNPKTGTTWLKAMAFALLNRSRFLHQDQHPLLTTNPHDLVPFLELTLYGGKDLPDLSTFTSPRLFATHSPFKILPRSIKDSSCKLVYLCRNPKDTLISYWNFVNMLRPKESPIDLEDAVDMFCNGSTGYGPFWDHVVGYWKESLKNPHMILFLKYEEIQEQPIVQLTRFAEFLECPFSPEELAKGVVEEISNLCGFDTLSKLEVNKTGYSVDGVPKQTFFRKGEVGGWKKVLTPEMVEKIDHVAKDKTREFGFKF